MPSTRRARRPRGCARGLSPSTIESQGTPGRDHSIIAHTAETCIGGLCARRPVRRGRKNLRRLGAAGAAPPVSRGGGSRPGGPPGGGGGGGGGGAEELPPAGRGGSGAAVSAGQASRPRAPAGRR